MPDSGGVFDVWTTADLRDAGLSARDIRVALASGRLIRTRRGHYVAGEAPVALRVSARIGGRLGCTSLLAALGVFVFDSSQVHVHMERGDSRMRGVSSRRLESPERRSVVLHWRRFVEPPASGAVHVRDALLSAVRCQSPRHAVATLDSALHLRLICAADVGDVFAALPQRFLSLRPLLDGRAESGTETLVRLMVRSLGHSVEPQVTIAGVGRVDLLVDGWLVVECDSREFHASWEQRRTDLRRDRQLAALGYSVLRLTADEILYRPDLVIAALRGVLGSSRRPTS